MYDIKTSDIVTLQIPEALQEEGPNLVAFMQAYYEWLDASEYGNDIELLTLRDIDETVDSFLQYFKETYLTNFPTLSPDRIRMFVKNIGSFYNARGSEESFKLLFRLLYGLEAKIYNPGQNILIASDGKWHKPIYLETTINFDSAAFINKTITGSQSGSTAVVENVTRKNVNGAFFSVVYISNVRGRFIAGERVTYNGDLTDAPIVLGSLNEIDVIEGGQNNQIGDVFDVESDVGRYGKARVTETENGTGRVDFNLIDGGSGYTLNAEAIISEKIYEIDPPVGDYIIFEGVQQVSSNITFLSANNTFAPGDVVEGYTSGTNVFQGNGVVVIAEQTGANGFIKVLHHSDYTDFDFADTIRKAGNTVSALIDTVTDTTATANVVGYDNTHVGVYNINNVFYVNGAITSHLSNTSTTIIGQSSGTGAHFGIGSLSGEETVWINTDRLGGNNVVDVPYLNIILSGEGSGVGFIEDVTIAAGGTGYTNATSIQFSGGGQHLDSVTVAAPGTGYANGERIIVTAPYGSGATGSVTTDGSGGIVSVTIGNGGKQYRELPTITVDTSAGTGASLTAVSAPTVNAAAEITTDGAGVITSVNVSNIGDGFFSYPTLTVPGGTGANLVPVIDWGYGFPKMPQGDLTTVINECLTSESVVIGIISSLGQISPGAGYNQDPFVLVVEPFTSAMNRKDLVLSLANTSGSFTVGEIVNQNIIEPAQELSFAINTGPGFEVGEIITQGSTTATVYYREPTKVRVFNIQNGPFVPGAILGSISDTDATVSTVSTISRLSIAKGRVKEYSPNDNSLTLARLSFNTSFNDEQDIVGQSSQSTASIVSVIQDENSLAMGNNSIVTAEVKTANGIATKIEVIDSGFGYVDDYEVLLVNTDNQFSIRGLTTVNTQGEAEGYWLNTDGFLNSDKHLHDGEYYQTYSYEIQVGLSLDRYADIIKKLLHTAGTKMFGRYVLVTSSDLSLVPTSIILDGAGNEVN